MRKIRKDTVENMRKFAMKRLATLDKSNLRHDYDYLQNTWITATFFDPKYLYRLELQFRQEPRGDLRFLVFRMSDCYSESLGTYAFTKEETQAIADKLTSLSD